MDLIDQLQSLSAKIQKERDLVQTEEATKTAFVLPFLSALGYDIFDPQEVVPEYIADVGKMKDAKIDYAILRDGQVTMLLECKACSANLDDEHAKQLFHYFATTGSRIGVLTNGILYRFFSDIEKQNKMDSKPFMEFNMLDIQEPLVTELKRLHKQVFNIEEIVSVAGELKYTREIRRIIGEEFASPSDELVGLLAHRVYPGKLMEKVREQFRGITRRAFSQFVSDTINERLRSAMAKPEGGVPSAPTPATPDDVASDAANSAKGVVTTEEELQAFYIVKAVLCQIVDPSRITHKDSKTCFTVRLDNNQQKPVCRFYFGDQQKKIGLIDDQKQEQKVAIDSLADIYKHADRLKGTVGLLETLKPMT